jgi:hypothetical protein
MGMNRTRLEAIRAFADKLAERIHRKTDRRLKKGVLMARSPSDARRALMTAQRTSAEEGELLFGLEEYANVWLSSEGDEWLVLDLVAIRLIERLHQLGESLEDVLQGQDKEEMAEETR